MKIWQKIALILGIILVIFLVIKKITAPAVGITSAKVERRTLTSGFTSNGRVKAGKFVDLKFPAPAKIAWISVKEGDQVRAWQGIAGLDTVSLNAAYESALNTLRDAQASADQVLDSVQGHSGDESFALRATRTSAQVARDNAYNAVLAAKDALDQSMLITPIRGTVVATNDILPGLTLSSADLASKTITIADLNTLYFSTDVDEIDFSKVVPGQEAVVSFDAYPGQSCQGKVTRVGQNGQETTGGVVTIPVRISLTDCKLNLALNLNGQAEIVSKKADNALSIPKNYLVTKNGQNYVYLKTGSSVKNRALVKVTTGFSSATDVEITSGLKEGDTVLRLP